MDKKPRIGINTFMMPGQEKQAMAIMNHPEIVVTINERYPCPKEGIILLHLQYEDYRDYDVYKEEE